MIAAEMIGIFQQFVEAEFAEDVAARTEQLGADAPAAALPRTDAQRRFDALVAIDRAAVLAPADGVAPKPVVNVLVGLATLEHLLADHGLGARPGDLPVTDLTVERLESSTGVRLAPDDIVRAALQGVVRRVVIDAAGVVVDAGRKRDSAPPATLRSRWSTSAAIRDAPCPAISARSITWTSGSATAA